MQAALFPQLPNFGLLFSSGENISSQMIQRQMDQGLRYFTIFTFPKRFFLQYCVATLHHGARKRKLLANFPRFKHKATVPFASLLQ